MSSNLHRLLFATAALMMSAAINPAAALTTKECSVKYKAAQSAGTLGGVKWNEFRKTQCAANASPTTPTPTPASAPATPASPAAPSTAGTGNAVFPSAVSPKYAGQSGGKARMHTCLDQYNQNKANSGNGGLKWIQKGGGYYSECNKRLKG